jgi:hypothetical protein
MVGKYAGTAVLYRESGERIEQVDYQVQVDQEYHLGIIAGQAKRIQGAYTVTGVLQVDAKKRLSPPVLDLIKNPGVCRMQLDQTLPWGTNELRFTPKLVNAPKDGIFRIVESPPMRK